MKIKTKERSARPHPAPAAEADRRDEGAAASQRVPQRHAHLRAGHRRPERSRRSSRRRPSMRTLKGELREGRRGGNLKGAEAIGNAIAERSIEKGIKRVVFDRSGFLYHGRIRAVADAARKAGLEF